MLDKEILYGKSLTKALYNNTLAGKSFGIPLNFFDMLTVLRKMHRLTSGDGLGECMLEDLDLERDVINQIHVYVGESDALAFNVRLEDHQPAKISLYGCYDHFPLYRQQVMMENADKLKSIGIQIDPNIEKEHVISNLNNYKLPQDRLDVAAKSGLKLELEVVENVDRLLDVYCQEPTNGATNNILIESYIHTQIHDMGIEPEIDIDYSIVALEEMFADYHRVASIIEGDIAVQTCSSNIKLLIKVNGEVLGAITVNRDLENNRWYLSRIDRLRFGYSLRETCGGDYNIDNAILCAFIKKAQEEGIKFLNLGIAANRWDYIKLYTAETISISGLSFS